MRSDPVIAADDIELCAFDIAHQPGLFVQKVDVGARLSGLPFVGSIDDSRQFTERNHNRRDSAIMMNVFHAVGRKPIELLVECCAQLYFFICTSRSC